MLHSLGRDTEVEGEGTGRGWGSETKGYYLRGKVWGGSWIELAGPGMKEGYHREGSSGRERELRGECEETPDGVGYERERLPLAGGGEVMMTGAANHDGGRAGPENICAIFHMIFFFFGWRTLSSLR